MRLSRVTGIGLLLLGLCLALPCSTYAAPMCVSAPADDTPLFVPAPDQPAVPALPEGLEIVPQPAPVAPPPVAAPKTASRPKGSYRNLRVMATAYALRGYTSRGTYTVHGTIAVDPRVIPFGSRIYVPGYGWGTALDTGGAIRGHVIDLWMPSNSACFRWGVRSVNVLVEHPHRRPVLLASRKGRRPVHHRRR